MNVNYLFYSESEINKDENIKFEISIRFQSTSKIQSAYWNNYLKYQ